MTYEEANAFAKGKGMKYAEVSAKTGQTCDKILPLMVRDTQRTSQLVDYLTASGILATGLNYPVVPKGDEEIRFQISAEHTARDIDGVLEVLAAFPGRSG